MLSGPTMAMVKLSMAMPEPGENQWSWP